MDLYAEENDDLANLMNAPMPVPAAPKARPNFSSDLEGELGALDHLDKQAKKEQARRQAEEAKERKRQEKEARRAARDAEKAERKAQRKADKEAKAAQARAEQEAKAKAAAARRAPPPPPAASPAKSRPVLAPVSTPQREQSVYERSVLEHSVYGDEPPSPSTFERFEDTAPAKDLSQQSWSKDQVDNFVSTLFQGEHFVKYGAFGTGKTKFCIANQEGSFFWSDRGGKTMNSIKLVHVTNVLRGKQTKVLKRKACRDVPAEHCLSIVTDKRTVDLEAPTAAARDKWVHALRYAAGNVQTHGKVMLHPVTSNEMERKQRELAGRVAALEAERERQERLLREKEESIARAERELAEERERASRELSAKERELQEKEERESALLAEKARLAAEVQRIAHERQRSSSIKNGTLKQLQAEVEALQAVKREAEEKAAREKEQMAQLINESQKLLAKAKGTIHKRQTSRAQHLTRIQQLEAELAEVERRNRDLREKAAAAEAEDSEHVRRASDCQEALAAAAAEQGVEVEEPVELDSVPEEMAAAAAAAPAPAAAEPVRQHRRGHRSTISIAEVLTPAVWQPDGARVDCNRCTTRFTFFRRRHHCRKCGLLVCGSCSSRKAKIEETCDKVRVCEHCIAEHGYKAE